MIGYVFLALSLAMLALVFRIGRQIWRSYQHVDEATMRSFMYGRLKKGSEKYQQVISHLGYCQECRDLLDRIQHGKPLEDHLVE